MLKALPAHRSFGVGNVLRVLHDHCDPSLSVSDEVSEVYQAYVRDISDRTGLPPQVVAPVFHDILRTLSSDATVETFVILLAAKKTLTKLKTMPGHHPTSQR